MTEAMTSASHTTPAPGSLAGVLVTAFAAVSISLTLVLTPLVYDAGMSPLTVIAVRPLVFAAAVWLLYRATSRPLSLPGRDRAIAFGLGVLYLIGTGGYLASVVTLPISLAVLVFYTYPLLTLVISCLVERQRPRALELAALLVALVGLALALGVEFDRLHPVGLALVGTGALAMANSFYWLGRKLGGVDTAVATFHMGLSGFAVGLAALLASGTMAWPDQQGAWGWLLFAGILVTFTAGFFGMFRGVALIGSVRAATIMNLEPVATIGLAFVILGERLTAWQLVGAALVVGAVVAAQRRR